MVAKRSVDGQEMCKAKETETEATMDTLVDEKEVSVDEKRTSSPGKRERIRNKLSPSKQKKKDSGTYDERFLDECSPQEESLFWMSPLLQVQYVIVTVALVSRRLWVLQGTLLVMSAYMAYVVYTWICYILRDPQLHKCVASMRWYFGFAMRQAEKTVQGGKGRRMVEAGVLAWRGTTTSFLKWFIRQRSKHLNQVMIQQHQANVDRLRRWQQTIHS